MGYGARRGGEGVKQRGRRRRMGYRLTKGGGGRGDIWVMRRAEGDEEVSQWKGSVGSGGGGPQAVAEG